MGADVARIHALTAVRSPMGTSAVCRWRRIFGRLTTAIDQTGGRPRDCRSVVGLPGENRQLQRTGKSAACSCRSPIWRSGAAWRSSASCTWGRARNDRRCIGRWDRLRLWPPPASSSPWRPILTTTRSGCSPGSRATSPARPRPSPTASPMGGCVGRRSGRRGGRRRVALAPERSPRAAPGGCVAPRPAGGRAGALDRHRGGGRGGRDATRTVCRGRKNASP